MGFISIKVFSRSDECLLKKTRWCSLLDSVVEIRMVFPIRFLCWAINSPLRCCLPISILRKNIKSDIFNDLIDRGGFLYSWTIQPCLDIHKPGSIQHIYILSQEKRRKSFSGRKRFKEITTTYFCLLQVQVQKKV